MNYAKMLILMIISLLISALTFNLFITKMNIVTGGVNGIAIIINNLFNIENSIVIFFQLLLLMVLSIVFLGFKRTTGSIISVFLYPFFVKITSYIPNNVFFDNLHYITLSLLIGIFTGIANGIMYRTKFSNGGLPIINQILLEYKHIPIEKSSFLINMIIVILGGLYTSVRKVPYSLLIISVNSIIIRVIINKNSLTKSTV